MNLRAKLTKQCVSKVMSMKLLNNSDPIIDISLNFLEKLKLRYYLSRWAISSLIGIDYT